MFNNPKSQAPFQLERIRLKLQGFFFTVDYIKGTKNPSDYLSRHATAAKKFDLRMSSELEAHVHLITKDNVSSAITNDQIQIILSMMIFVLN